MPDILGRTLSHSAAIASRWRNFYFRALGVRFGGYAWLRRIHIPRNWRSISIGRDVALDHGVQLLATTDIPSPDPDTPRLCIGAGAYINRYTIIDAHLDLRIGESCMIGPFCYLTDADHDYSTGGPVGATPMKADFLHIKAGTWIGSHCVLLPGITIGENAIIGAGSIVTSDIAPNTVAVGSPARPVKTRIPR